jgi:hypothetical protein
MQGSEVNMAKPQFDYNEVSERVRGFNESHPNGTIHTEYQHQSIGGDPYVVVKATVFKDAANNMPDATGHSWMKVPGATNFTRGSELENTETSAVGRALAFIGFYAKGESLASKQEIAAKRGDDKPQGDLTKQAKAVFKDETEKAVVGQKGLTDEQRKLLFATLRTAGVSEDTRKAELSQILGRTIRSVKDMTGEDLDLVIKYFASE